MAHALTERADGRVEFAYREAEGQAWHGLGQPLPDGASIADWTAAAGMDWEIQRAVPQYLTHAGATIPRSVGGSHVLFRSDSGDHLGIVSDRYQVVQPREVLEFFRDLVRAGGLELSSAGTILGGRRFWATAKIGEASPLGVRDKVGGYLLLATSADGSLATEARLTSIRVVCQNTLRMARADGKPALRVSHRSVFDAAEVKRQMGLNSAAWDAFRHNIVKLANKPVPVQLAEEVVSGLLATEDSQTGKDKARDSAGFKKVLSLFGGEGKGSTLDGSAETAWGLLNAVTEYADHHVRARSDENRFVSSQWGPGALLKDRALETLLAL